jgi:beta-lactamase regulating signal transducer with metallopeptidase domain
VAVLASSTYDGPPFVAGVFRPYVLFAASTVERLSSGERRAVLEHELAHLTHWDAVVVTAVIWLTNVFWFFPGGGWLARRIRTVLELNADDAAVRSGVDPRELASALISVAETLRGLPAANLAAGRTPSSLALRASRLLAPAASRRRGVYFAQLVGLVIAVACVISSIFFGNAAAPPAPLH